MECLLVVLFRGCSDLGVSQTYLFDTLFGMECEFQSFGFIYLYYDWFQDIFIEPLLP